MLYLQEKMNSKLDLLGYNAVQKCVSLCLIKTLYHEDTWGNGGRAP